MNFKKNAFVYNVAGRMPLVDKMSAINRKPSVDLDFSKAF